MYLQAYQSWSARNGEEPSMPGFDHLSNEQMFFLTYGQVGFISLRPNERDGVSNHRRLDGLLNRVQA